MCWVDGGFHVNSEPIFLPGGLKRLAIAAATLAGMYAAFYFLVSALHG